MALPQALAERARKAKAHVFGVRPENVALSPQAVPGEVALPASVVICEPLGAETLVTFQIGQAELVARCAASFKAASGSVQTLYLDPALMHVFDKDSGLAL